MGERRRGKRRGEEEEMMEEERRGKEGDFTYLELCFQALLLNFLNNTYY